MNPEQLLAHYHRIADAPDAIPQLRRFILDLAVRGKLVPQNPNDEPALELLKRIEAEKARMVKAGETRKEKPLLRVTEDAVFSIPPTWCWTRLGIVTSYIQRGKSPKYAALDGSPVVSQKCVQWSRLDLTHAKQITLESLEEYEEIRFLRSGDLLWNSTGTGTIGRVIRLVDPPERLVCDSHVTVVRCLIIDPEYVRVWLRSDHVYALIEDRAAGSTNQVELTSQMAINQVVPLPPLAEQQRIVARVDDLMALCDHLEVSRENREATRDRLTAASLARLSRPDPDPQAFRDHFAFALDNLAALAARSDQVKALRQTILNLAVRGKLVPQDSNDEPIEKALVLADRQRQEIARNDPRADEGAQELLAGEARWDVPSHWSWRGLADLVLFVDYRGNTPPKTTSGVRLITAKNVRQGFISLTPEEFVSEQTYKVWMRRGFPSSGDILFTTEAPMGNAAIVNITEEFALAQRVICFQPYGATNSGFLMLQLLSEPFQNMLNITATGLTAKGIKAAKLKRLPIALPPLAEQQRIVAKVDELMQLCDRLEASLTDTAATRRRLLDAILHAALAPAEEISPAAVA